MSKRLILALLLFVLVACRREEQPTPQPTTAAGSEATNTAEPAEEPTAPPVTTGAATEETTPEPTAAATGTGEEPIYLAIIWHQHQPVYYQDPATGVYAKPWVRVHASKDYVDMAAILEQYPDIHATFNLTPSLIRQLDDLAAGTKDLYWVYSEIPADQLSDEQKQFILDRFFDINRKIIGRFPRYQDLLVKRDSSDNPLQDYTTQDYLDLQILFNLGWTDPDWLAEEPLASLVAKGENFSEEDKAILFAEHLRLIQEVVPVHQRLQDAGQIEVTMTPFAHPILPLLISTDLAREALPEVELPSGGFVYGQDAVTHLELGVQLYEEHFGRPPRGMWPAEGSVAQEIVNMVANVDIQWMASDEGVLANSLGMNNFTRDPSEVVIEADTLYRPYYVQGASGRPVAMVFRDVVISDKVGFTYSGLPGEVAAADFINRIHAIREQLIAQGAEGPHLVSVILDGENAWEHYDNDGKEFLHSMYQRLSEDPLIRTVTPTEFLEIAPEQPMIEDLWAGSWINHDFATWIGEDEENRAWEHLAAARELLRKYENGTRQTTPEALAEAQLQMYIAEGSDWFWWYGADQNSGNDEDFDQQFRDTLKAMYLALGEEPPLALNVPIIPQQAVSAERPATGLISPTIEGIIGEGEWDAAGLYTAEGGVMASADPVFDSLAYGFDSRNLYINVNSAGPWAELGEPGGLNTVELYLSVPGGGPANSFSEGGALLGFPANRLLEASIQNGELLSTTMRTAEGNEVWGAEATALELAAVGGNSLEAAIPLALLGNADVGDRITMRLIFNQTITVEGTANPVDTAQVPGTGPAVVAVPDLGTTTIILDVNDPEGDDHGPGAYTYPQDAVFKAGNFDITNFQVGFDEENIVFRFTLAGPVDNPWGSPNGLALQTLDIYIDQDGDGSGGTAMLPGRNLAFQEGYAWDFAITAEGWEPGVFVPAEGGQEKIAGASEMFILADPGQQKVTIRVPKSILGDNPEAWQYAAVIMSQEGFPSGGVMRVRDVNPAAEQWRVGGAPAGSTNHTRVIDLVWAAEGEQEVWLSEFTPTDLGQPELTAENFAQVPMFGAQE
jgi:alpha-amylase/alpha-mannosidase (GH57 family)